MQLDTITMDRHAARKAFLEYRDAIRSDRHDQLRKEDEQIMRAYREAAKGVSLIRLSDALAAGGTQQIEVAWTNWSGGRRVRRTQEKTVPRLAVARADVEKVWTDGVDAEGGCVLRYERGRVSDRETRKRFQIATGTFEEAGRETWGPSLVAMAPTIPPALRPRHHLRNYHLLWEAEWAQEPQPPVDPALLKHLGGDLYAVLGVWDLTPLERAVLAGTRA